MWVAKAIQQMERQTRTNTHYRQQKYNLVQEESEGYAKLIDTLHNHFTITTSTTSTTLSHNNTTHLTAATASGRLIGQRVTALIGYFDWIRIEY